MSTSYALPAGPIAAASSAIAAGGPVIVTTGSGEGNLVCAAGSATTELIAFMVRHTSGYLAVAVPELECERLDLPPMYARAGQRSGLDHRVTVDAASGISTGISARDRAHTARLLADPTSAPATFTRPGHVVPVAARAGGVLARPGEAEAGVDLVALAGLSPCAVMARIVSPTRPERMADHHEVAVFGRDHRLPIVDPADLASHAGPRRTRVVRAAVTPTPGGPGQVIGYLSTDGAEHLALVAGPVAGRNAVPTHVHHECLLGDVFGTPRCSCRRRLDRARRVITERGGVLIYLRPAHGGLRASHPCPRTVRACSGDTDRGIPGEILRDLGVRGTAPLFGELPTDPASGPRESIPTVEVA